MDDDVEDELDDEMEMKLMMKWNVNGMIMWKMK